jgi:drug/metabolite transporter (DMT)-like permease
MSAGTTHPFASMIYALTAVCFWGTSDFIGGHTARRFSPFFLAALGHLSGTMMVASLAWLGHAPMPPVSHLGWAMAAGTAGGFSLALFYRALSQGNMGVAAAISAVLGAALPAAFGMVTEGLPHGMALAGFLLAMPAVWLISRAEGGGRPQGLALASLAGCGFALFFVFMREAGTGAALWMAAASRGASLVVTGLITLIGRRFEPVYPAGFALALVAGCLDVSGTVMFVRASQTGRLDTAVVLTSLYPAITVLLARMILKERFTLWKTVGMIAALAAVPMIAGG